MNSKYRIQYQYNGDPFVCEYQTNSFVKLVFKMIFLMKKFKELDIYIRK